MIELIALHKHWCIADAVRIVIGAPIMKPEQEAEAIKRFGPEFALLGERASMVARISVWYSLLYVVVEGYQELEHKFEPLDALLAQEEYVNLLRLFRNATFHYQEDPLTEKIIGFLDKKDSEHWIRELNKQFQSFFLKALPISETLQRIEAKGA
jgi:hypothetical protein